MPKQSILPKHAPHRDQFSFHKVCTQCSTAREARTWSQLTTRNDMIKHQTWGFYIFTIITDGAHQIITLRMTPTSIPAERSLSYFFTTFADVVATAAGHASVESAVCQRRAPAVTARWTLCLILGTRWPDSWKIHSCWIPEHQAMYLALQPV